MTREEILKTEFGIKLTTLVKELDMAIQQRAELNIWVDLERAKGLDREIKKMLAKLEIFELGLKSFAGLELNFTRTDEYYGLCSEDESYFLIREERRSK